MTLTALSLFTASLLSTPTQWSSKKSEITYTVVHKFHEVNGVAKNGQITAVAEDRGVKVMARVQPKSFDSGNSNRDAHVLEVLHAQKFPWVTLKGLHPGKLDLTPGRTLTVPLKTELTLHGVKRTLKVPVKLTVESPRRIKATFELTTSLEGHGIERPSLLFVPVDDTLVVRGQAVLEPGA